MMKSIRISLSMLMIVAALSSCEKMAIDKTYGNALIIRSARADNIVGTYSIGSAYQGGSVVGSDYVYFHLKLYSEKYSSPPDPFVNAIVEINGNIRSQKEVKDLGEWVDQIVINGLDESLGLGSRLDILMNHGVYEGDNEKIKEVSVKSLKLATYKDSIQKQNKDCDIYIVIESTAGDVITIRFAHEATPFTPWELRY